MALSEDILAARILVVDDQIVNVQLLTRLLAETGYTNVEATQDPSLVVPQHAQQPYDLILLDLQMPVLDGFAVMRDLRTVADDPVLPVIVLTAQPAHKLRALQSGARDFISKPFDLLEVKTRIHHMLEVRLLHRQLAAHNALLEATVRARTAELRESEERYRSLTELASDWYWEQDEHGNFVRLSGPVQQMLGIPQPLPLDQALSDEQAQAEGWDLEERRVLQARISDRLPFLDYRFHRRLPDGTRAQYRVSGQPLFDAASRFLGYRGIGVNTSPDN